MRTLTEDDYITSVNIKKIHRGEWVVILISSGKKRYVTRLYKESKEWQEAKNIKMSDPSVLKLKEKLATKVALLGKHRYTKVGIVNQQGLQIIL